MSYMIELFDSLIRSVTSEIPVFDEKVISCDRQLPLKDCTVDIFEKKYDDIARLHLTIPNYQRIYCWEKKVLKPGGKTLFLGREN